MTDRDLHLSAKHCNEAFPFHLILDEHLCIMQISAKFLKFIPKLKPGQNFQDVLINEDDMALLTYDEINSRVDKGYVFRTKDTKGPRFRIGFYETSDANLLLVATPIITNSRDILGASLSFDDFAPHDTILEHISVVQTKDSMFKDMRAFADRLEMLIEERTAELNKSQKVLSEAQRIGGLGSWDLNVHTGEAHWSDQRFRMFGYEPDEIEASFENLKKSLHPDDLDRVVSEVLHAGRTKEKLDTQFRIIRPNGEQRIIRSIGETIGDDDFMSGTVRDITERKQAEDKILLAMQNAERANHAKSNMLANMSHELRTPLNAIIGFSSTMIAETFGPLNNDKYREYLDDINQSGIHLLDLINDILDLSAIEADAVELQEENISTSELIEITMRLIKPRANDGHVTLTSSIAHDIPMLFADERRVKQILLNLLSNAVKFTPEDGVVSVNAHMNGAGSLAITVKDTGVGMDEGEVKHAMSKFGQLDTDLDRKHEGTGLGLPLTKGLMELHDGTLIIQSEKGLGTTITVTFPKARVIHTI